MKRQFDPALPELMDRSQPLTAELERDLANLRSLNRWFGSHKLVLHFLRRWVKPGTQVRILDVGTGSGDIPRLVVDFARRHRITADVDAIDRQPTTLEVARRLSRSFPEINFVCADLFAWDPHYRYDIVLFSLTLHHFSWSDALRALRRCRALSAGGVLVADLRRTQWLRAAIYLLTAILYRERMTKIDARLSAIRAFTFEEMHQLAQLAGWKGFGHRRFAVGRQAVWIDP